MNNSRENLLSGLIIFVVALTVYIYIPFQIKTKSIGDISYNPRFWPMIILAILGLNGILLVILALKKSNMVLNPFVNLRGRMAQAFAWMNIKLVRSVSSETRKGEGSHGHERGDSTSIKIIKNIFWKISNRQFIFAGIVLAYISLIHYLGFIVSTILGLLALLRFSGSRNLKFNIIFVAIYTILVYYIFTTVFKVRFPQGVFWNI